MTKIDFFLTHPDQRVEIAVEGYRRAVRDHLSPHRMRQLGELIGAGIRIKASQDDAYRISPSGTSSSLTQY